MRIAADDAGWRDVHLMARYAERRELMHANERRLQRYLDAAREWASVWPEVERSVAGVPLELAHATVVARALNVLPFAP